MNVVKTSKDEIVLSFSSLELLLLCNAINESLEAVREWVYRTRTGATVQEALALHAQLREALHNHDQEHDGG